MDTSYLRPTSILIAGNFRSYAMWKPALGRPQVRRNACTLFHRKTGTPLRRVSVHVKHCALPVIKNEDG